MTFYNAPWALDGATISSALARRAQYAAMSGAEGIVNAADLKVSQLAVAGNGLLISAGNAAITNRYETDPNETYTIANPGVHTILSTEMPSSQPTAKSYLVLITVGDPEFSQVGHPWMTSDVLDPSEAADYVYVRPWLLQVAAGTTSFDGLGLNYPALALARIDIPANTTTITNAMITDLRTMARPRSLEVISNITGFSFYNMESAPVDGTYVTFGGSWSMNIPKWATSASITGWIAGIAVDGTKGAAGDIRATITGAGSSPSTFYDENNEAATAGNWQRVTHNVGGKIAIPSAIRGTAQTVKFEAENRPAVDVNHRSFWVDSQSTSLIRVRFEETPV